MSCGNRNGIIEPSESQILPTLLPTGTPIWWQNFTQEPMPNEVPFELPPVKRGRILSLAVTPDGELVAVATQKGLWIYETNTLTPLAFYKGLFGQYVVWTADSSELLIWYGQYNLWALMILDLETSQSRLSHLEEVPELASNATWTSNENLLAFAGRRKIYIWDIFNARQLWTIDVEANDGYQLDWSPDGQLLSIAEDSTITIWERENRQKLTDLSLDFGGPSYNWFSDLTWSPDGKYLAIVAGSSGDKLIWDIENNTVNELPHFSMVAKDVTWSPDGKKLAFNEADKIYIMEVSSSDLLQTIETGRFAGKWFLAWLPDSKHLISGGNEQMLALWDTENGQLLYEVTTHID
jgi:WD40 repeat protein